MHSDWPLALFLLLISPAVGSFLGVLVDRLPKGRGLLGASSCESCGEKLRWRDMVPILSGLALRGRCRNCGAAIPGHLMRLEVVALLLALAAVVLVLDPVRLMLVTLLLWGLAGLFYADLLHFRLPDLLTGAVFFLGLGLAIHDPGRGLADGVLSAAIGAGAFWLIRWGYFLWRGREGLGLGDIKLMAGIGAALGWQTIPMVTLLAAVLALVVAGAKAAQQQSLPKADARLPFGSFLCTSAAIFLLI